MVDEMVFDHGDVELDSVEYILRLVFRNLLNTIPGHSKQSDLGQREKGMSSANLTSLFF
jgi:hypothetical protein